MVIRTRFAPSPTGFLHVGSVRTALYCWLYAKHHQGEFFLRIEDTDHQRSTQESVQAILDGLAWVGLESDKPIVYQTDRFSRYQEVVQELLEQGLAYRCTCSKERLEKLRQKQLEQKQKPRYDGCCREKEIEEERKPHVIRFKTPKIGSIVFQDQVYGHIEVANEELDDLVLVREDGYPTYNFAVVVDDKDMEITHVIRGDDHLNNTPRQIHLYHALKATIPIFAHLPMILGEDGKRLSKRHGAISIMEFKKAGYLPEALLNYLVRLGWSHQDQEIFSLEEMVQYFDLSKVSRGVSSFSYPKLMWLNQHYIKTAPPERTAEALLEHFEEQKLDCKNGPSLASLVILLANRSKTLVELVNQSHYFYQDTIQYEEDAVRKHLALAVKPPLEKVHQELSQLETWQAEEIHSILAHVCEDFSISMGKIGQPLRVALTGSTASPSLDHTIAFLGKKRVLSRLQYALIHYIR